MSYLFRLLQICLVGEDGQALLHRISPINDPLAAEQDALAICKVRLHSIYLPAVCFALAILCVFPQF